jgi:hypothetical protein
MIKEPTYEYRVQFRFKDSRRTPKIIQGLYYRRHRSFLDRFRRIESVDRRIT